MAQAVGVVLGRKHDHRRVALADALFEAPAQPDAVKAIHDDVQEDEVDMRGLGAVGFAQVQVVERRLARLELQDVLVALAPQELLQGGAGQARVVHDHDLGADDGHSL